jgi:hypothetical protein
MDAGEKTGSTLGLRWPSICRIRLILALSLLSVLASPAAAHAYVYWSNLDFPHGFAADSLGRANLDGSAPTNAFVTGAGNPCGTAVDSTYVYWANSDGASPSIGRVRVDGTAPPEINWISGLTTSPCGVAVDASHVYWASGNSGSTVGRADLDGSNVNESFVTAALGPCGVAVDAAHVYWANSTDGTIGRAELDGITDKNQSFVSGPSTAPCGVAVDSSYLYWGANSSIGRATLDGVTDVDASFITGGSGMETPALDGSYIYWANKDSDAIGRARIDGSLPDQGFVTGLSGPVGVAVDSLGPTGGGGGGGTTTPPPDTTAPTASLSSSGGKKGTKAKKHVGIVVSCGIDACLAFVNGVLEVVPSGGHKSSAAAAKKKKGKKKFKLRGVSLQIPANASATATLTIPKKALKQARKALKHKGKARIRFTASVSDTAGNASTATRTVKLRR